MTIKELIRSRYLSVPKLLKKIRHNLVIKRQLIRIVILPEFILWPQSAF